MKTITMSAIVGLVAAGSMAVAQTDTTQVYQNTVTTTTTQTQVSPPPQQTVVVTQTVPANSTATQDDNTPPLRHGELGLRYMPTFAALDVRGSGGETIQGEVSMSHGWGIMGAINFDRHVGLQAELNYHQIHQKYKDQGLDRQVNVSYLNIPVLLSLNTNKAANVNLNFVIGPQFGINVGADASGGSNGGTETVHAVVGVKGGDVGAAYGVGLGIMLNQPHTLRLDFGFRGYYGLVDISSGQTSSNPDTYNVIVSATRKTYAGYLGLTFCF